MDEHFSYEAFKDYVLCSCPRTMHACPELVEQTAARAALHEPAIDKSKDGWWKSFLLLLIVFIAGRYILRNFLSSK